MLSVLVLWAAIAVQQPDYEWQLCKNLLHNTTENYWTLDRESDRKTVSVSATGLGFYAYAVAAHRGVIRRETASAWIRTGFDGMRRVNPPKNCGWLYHFVDLQGNPALNSEVSSIDTVIFYLGAERAAQLLDDKPLLKHILDCKSKIDLLLMTDVNGYFYHSFDWDDLRLIQSKWKWTSYNEGVIIYKYFDKPFQSARPVDYSLPLFVFFYPLAFFPDERQWIDHLGKAIDYQLEQTGKFGYSAMDGKEGYVVNSPYYVSPLGVFSCRRYFPVKAEKQLRQYGVDWLTPSISVNGRWRSQDKVLLDQGIALMLTYGQRK